MYRLFNCISYLFYVLLIFMKPSIIMWFNKFIEPVLPYSFPKQLNWICLRFNDCIVKYCCGCWNQNSFASRLSLFDLFLSRKWIILDRIELVILTVYCHFRHTVGKRHGLCLSSHSELTKQVWPPLFVLFVQSLLEKRKRRITLELLGN